jgi:flagellar biogenesis protein FliO
MAWASPLTAQTAAPLIEYRRADAQPANPLREQPPLPGPATEITPSPSAPTHVVPAAATIPAASPSPQPVYRDAQFDASVFQDEEPKEQAPNEVEAAQPLESAPVAPIVDPIEFDAAGAAAEPESPALRLAPPSTHARTAVSKREASPVTRIIPQSFSKFTSLSTAGGGLAIVVGLFLVSTWLVRGSGGAKHGGTLPPEAFAVLGRAPLTAQSFAQLLRLGNKLVLVAVAAEGAQPLAEVTDPAEVDRLVGLCAKTAPNGPTAEFQQVLEQLSREPARGFLGREASRARRRA